MAETSPVQPDSTRNLTGAAAAIALAAAFAIAGLAAVTSRWLLVGVFALLLLAPVIRHLAARYLVRTSPLPEEEQEFPRMVALMSHGDPRIPRVGVRTLDSQHSVAFVTGWPGGQTLTVSDGLLQADVGALKGVVARELHRTTQPLAALDGHVWALPVAAVVVAAFRFGAGAFSSIVALLVVAVAIAAVTVLVHARERGSDQGGMQLVEADREVAVADGIELLDRDPPRGIRWWPIVGLLLALPASRWVRGFVHPDTAQRASWIRQAQARSVLAPPVVAPLVAADRPDAGASSEADTDEVAKGETDPTARAVFLSVLGILALLLVLALSTLGGGGDESTAEARSGNGSASSDGEPASGATDGDDGESGSQTPDPPDTNVCPSGSNGEPDPPVLIDGEVWTAGTDLFWRVLWCDDADSGDAWIILHLAYDSPRRSRRIITRKVTARSHPVETRFRVVPAHLGIAPGRYRWTLVVRDINAQTDRIRGTTIFVPGIP